MKERISLTLDPHISRSAKVLARRKKISLSSWVESLLREQVSREFPPPSSTLFSKRWTGSMTVAQRSGPRHQRLVEKYIQRDAP